MALISNYCDLYVEQIVSSVTSDIAFIRPYFYSNISCVNYLLRNYILGIEMLLLLKNGIDLMINSNNYHHIWSTNHQYISEWHFFSAMNISFFCNKSQ